MFKSFKYWSCIVLLLPAAVALAQQKKSTIVDSLINIKPIEQINIGYINPKRTSITGAVSIVNENRVKDLAAVSIDALLQGQAAGVQVVNISGSPGAGALINVRGLTTINAGSQPLFIVDGIPVKSYRFSGALARNADNNPLADINPDDIASITVLKDAHATALYGIRGANGVVIITTYGGTSGRTYLDFSGYTGVMQSPEPLSVLDADQYKEYILEKERARGLSEADINKGVGRYLLLSTPANQIERYNNNTNWQKDAMQNGRFNNYHLTLRGGDAVAKYSLNVGYTNQSGVLKNTSFERFTTRFNLDYKVGRKLSFLNTLSYTRTNKDLAEEGNAFNTNPLFLSAVKNPMLTAFQQTPEGEDLRDVDSADYTGRNNPYAVIDRLKNTSSTNRILGRITGQYTLSPYLNLRIAIAGDYFRLDESRFRPSAGFAPEGYIIRSAAAAKSYELMLMNENTLNYTRTSASGNHTFDATLGTAYQTTAQDAKVGVYVNATSDQFSGISSANETDPNLDSLGSASPSWKLMSFFGTVRYRLKNRYLFDVNMRADGSSRFAQSKRWGYFPSVGVAWRISDEAFLRNNKVISELKLRTSYGITGNQEVGYYNSFNAIVPAPYNNYSAVRLGILGNRDFQWEETKQFNVGLDAEFLEGRIGFALDLYTKSTDHLFNTIKLPGTSGFDKYAVSEGTVENKGVELGINGKILTGAFGWQTNITAAYNKNKIVSLPDKLDAVMSHGDYNSIMLADNAIGAFYGYNALGVYANSSDVTVKNESANTNPFRGGDIIFEDVDESGTIDEDDRKIIGQTTPDYYGGIYNVFSYKSFDLSVFIDFAVGNDVYNARRAALESMSNNDNQSTSINSRWQKEGDITSLPRLLHGDAVGNTRFSSRFIEDGSYARFKAVTLGYNFPLKGIFKNVFKNARLLVTAQNLHTFSNYKGFSPVVVGADYGNVPPLKTYMVGVKLGL
ncbi:SusC/RagA family TonB-linked outer membrane protein [Niastella sp. OAS944]|uniref:SusC/RagA family TonB-linked outer membrane protein n=1 Tax=Niastella sp. OAS944 TaxID=2664089 RepID=UPI00346ECFE3|nr:TonB-linked SusC/RagA family outer membrane protein [Chitinophagaceae bacterium OAS944]